jgi:hypothetical protein
MRRSAAVSFCAVLFTFFGCHTITEELPTKPSTNNGPTVNVPVPVVVTPVEVPTPSAPANPAPTPQPDSPNSAPTPNAPPPPNDDGGSDGPTVGQSCAPARAGNERCGREESGFLSAVDAAIVQVVAKRPSWFRKEGGTWKLVGTDEKTYDWAVIDQLRKNGYCAGLYSEEVSVRRSPGFSDNFDLLTSDFTVRRGEGSYRSTCRPAATTEE